MITVLKRDGRKVRFNKEKIVNAILKSFIAVDGEVSVQGWRQCHVHGIWRCLQRGDGSGAALPHIELGELLACQLARRVDGRSRLVYDDILHFLRDLL